MTDTPRRADRPHLFATFMVVFGAFCVQIVATGLYVFLTLEFQIDVIRFGWGQVPPERVGAFIWLSEHLWAILLSAGIAAFIATMVLFYRAGKTLAFLGVKQHFGPALTALSLPIPFYSFYRPWAGIGEVRNTLLDIRGERRLPRSGIRGINAETIFYAVIFYAHMLFDRFVNRYVDSVTASNPVDTAAGNLLLDRLTQIYFISTAVDVVFLGVTTWYWLSLIRLLKYVASLKLRTARWN